MTAIATHPVQNHTKAHRAEVCPVAVTMRAYDVYCAVYGPQPAMVTGGCRGGFSVGELIAFLYAAGFPKEQLTARVDEAFAGMDIG